MPVKSMVEFLQNFVAVSEYMNLNGKRLVDFGHPRNFSVFFQFECKNWKRISPPLEKRDWFIRAWSSFKGPIFWEGYKKIEKISRLVWRIPSNFLRKWEVFFKFVRPSQNICTLPWNKCRLEISVSLLSLLKASNKEDFRLPHKVQTFWEEHKIWKNLPHGLDVY